MSPGQPGSYGNHPVYVARIACVNCAITHYATQRDLDRGGGRCFFCWLRTRENNNLPPYFRRTERRRRTI